jgi:hypothetical protein
VKSRGGNSKRRTRSTGTFEALESRVHLAFTPGPLAWSQVTIKGTGFINGIEYSKVEPNLAYVYTDMGGAYRWDNAQASWKSLSDSSRYNDWSMQQLGVEGLAADPVDANRVYMVAGTYNSPAAVLSSSDRGATWSRWNAPWDNANNRPSWRVNGNGNGRNGGNRLAVDPNNPSIQFYGSRLDGLWKSSDRAASWSKVSSFTNVGDSTGAAGGIGIIFVLFDKSSGTAGSATPRIYVGVSTTTGNKIYVSSNAGSTWSLMANQPSATNLIPIRAALTPNGATMYVTYSNGPGPNDAGTGAVYKVTNPSSAGPTWTAMALPSTGGGGWSGVSIDPANPQRLVVTTLDRWNSPFEDLYLSNDAGATWWANSIRTGIDNTSAPYAGPIWPHWLGDVQFDPFNSNAAMVTTGNGLYRTTNLGNVDAGTTVNWRFFNDGIEQSLVNELQSPAAGTARLYSAIGDRDGFRHDDFSVSPPQGAFGQAQNLRLGSNSDVSVAWNDERYLVRSGGAFPYIQYSLDNGNTWAPWLSAPSTANGPGQVELSNDGTRALFSPSNGPISFSTRTGTRWSSWTASTFVGVTAPITARLVTDLSLPNTFYAMSAGSIYRSTDGGATFTRMTASASTNARALRSVPGQPGHLLMSTWFSSEGVLRSTDGGATWTRLAPSIVTQALLVGAGAAPPGRSYPAIYVAGTVGGKVGYFRSDDQGASWIELSDASKQFGIPQVLQGDPKLYGRLYIGTDGRGIQMVDFADRTAPQVIDGPRYDVNANAISVRFSEDVSGMIDAGDIVVTRSSDGSAIATTFTSYNAQTQAATFALPSGLANGTYSIRVRGSGISDAAGNYVAQDSTATFFCLAGDATRDQAVNFDDLLILASNYNKPSGASFTEGDFNRDGRVDFDDLLILASAYNTGLSGVPSGSAPSLVSSVPPPSSGVDDDDAPDSTSDVLG